MKVGFIGVGHMGGPMCRNIIKGDHEVTVYDLNAEAVQACVELGAEAGASAAHVASRVDVVMTSLPMPADVEAVALGSHGIAAGARPGTIFVDLSTNAPAMVRRIAAELATKDIVTLDAPVSGGVVGAEAATIAIMVGGDKTAYETCLPVFQSFGKTILHVGALGTGSIAKLVNNMIAFCTMAAAAEGLMLGAAAGIEPAVLNQVVRNSSGDSFGFRALAKKALVGDWSPNFAIELAYKDLHLALQMADELRVPLALGPPVHNLMRMACGMGFGDDDTTAMMRVYETILNREVRAE